MWYGILEVVEIAQIDVAVDGVAFFWPEQQVLDLGPADAFEPDRQLAVGDRLADDGDERVEAAGPQRRDRELDDEREHVGVVELEAPRSLQRADGS